MSDVAVFTSANALPGEGTFDASALKGKSVIITGGASGIGEAATRAFVRAGAFVTIGDFSPPAAERLVNELGTSNAASIKCDVRVWADQLALFKLALDKSPSKGIDVVIANAGISGQDDVYNDALNADGDPAEPDLKIIDTNLIGVLYTVKLAQHYLPRQPEGEGRDRCLLMTSSLAGYVDQPGSPQYQSSKFAVRALMRSIRRTGPWKGIRVNIIAPTFIHTKIISQEVVDRVQGAGIPLARVEDAAAALLHLASDRSINGRAVAVLAREEDPRGYRDLKSDDVDEDPNLKQWAGMAARVRHRVGTK